MLIRVVVCWLAISGGIVQASLHGIPGDRNAQVSSVSSFLGYDPGEVRRYVLGPRDSLFPEEMAEWSIGLSALVPRSSLAIFSLEYRWHAPRTGTLEPPAGVIVAIESTGELTVNAQGFPVDIQTHSTITRAQYGQEAHSVHYRLIGETLQKSVAEGRDTWSIEIDIPGHDHLDIPRQTGLFAYNPTVRPDCYNPDLGVQADGTPTGFGTTPAATSKGRRQVPAPNIRLGEKYDFICDSRNDLVFANPGLLSLAAPMLAESGGDREFLFLAPLWPLADLGFRSQARFGTSRASQGGTGVIRGSGVGGTLGDGMEPERGPAAAKSGANNFEKARLRTLRPRTVDVAGATFEAIRLEIDGPIERVWMTPDGLVLRIDMGDTLATGVRFVRLVLPEEIEGAG